MSNDRVKPRLSRGLRDLMPAEALARRRMIDTIRGVYELYGFVPIETPAIEYHDILTGSAGQEAQQSIFHVRNPEEEALGLRFDLTVPLARVVAQYRDLPRPFRRYQVASVWRADKPDPGRFREFTQFDLDSVGTDSINADIEIIAALCDTLTALEVGPYRVRFSSRRVLNLVMPFAGIPGERAVDVFRVLDKLDKIGRDRVRRELTTGYKDASGDTVDGLGLTDGQVDKIEEFLAIRSDDRDEVLARCRALFAGVDGADDEIDLVETLSRRLGTLGYGADQVVIDLSIARGLAYYTGPVFEAVLVDAPRFGSVAAGGRYDGLIERFSGQRVPAVGASIGVDRLLAALKDLGRAGGTKSTAQVLVTTIDPALMDDYVAMTFELRRAGIRTELYLGAPKRFGKQIKYADQYDIPIVLVLGSDENERGVVTVKDMAVGRERSDQVDDRAAWREERPGQFDASRADLVPAIRRLLDQIEGGSS